MTAKTPTPLPDRSNPPPAGPEHTASKLPTDRKQPEDGSEKELFEDVPA